MKVTVRYYSVLRGLAGNTTEPHELDGGATVADLLNRLFSLHPGFLPFQSSLLLACNNTYVPRDHPLCDGDTVDVMPPVSGG